MKFPRLPWRHWLYLSQQKLAAAAKSLWRFFYIRVYLLAALVLNLAAWAFAFAAQYRISFDQVVLHYNVDFGVDLYGDLDRLFFIPLIGLAIILVNLILAANIDKEDRLALHTLLATAAFSNLVLLLAVVSLYFYNLR